MVNSTNAGIIKGGPNPEMARIFVDFMLSPAGQKIYAERNYEYRLCRVCRWQKGSRRSIRSG
jgi:ABC-type Fe3+ transport system substrate-binding protein